LKEWLHPCLKIKHKWHAQGLHTLGAPSWDLTHRCPRRSSASLPAQETKADALHPALVPAETKAEITTQTGEVWSATQPRILALARKHWSFKAEVIWGLKQQRKVTCGWEKQISRTLMVLTYWELFWDFFSLTWILLILSALCKPTNFAVTKGNNDPALLLQADGGCWLRRCLMSSSVVFSLLRPAFSLETTHTSRFSHDCSASFLCTSGFNWPFDFVEPHQFSSSRPILLAPIHCSHLGKPESISALESFPPWSHYRAVQSPASLLKAQQH